MFSSKKPYTAITVQVDQLTMENHDENDLSGIPELIEVIRLQDSGPTEASRAIRKKLKYGNMHRQLRALTILDALVQNAGKRFQRSFADEPLLERLRILGSDSVTDPDVRKKCQIIFGQWAVAYKDEPGMAAVARLYQQLPSKPRARPQPRPPTPDRDSGPSSPGSSVSGDRRFSDTRPPASASHARTPSSPTSSMRGKKKEAKNRKQPAFNLEKEKPQMIQNIASASVAATNLKNALKHINREKERVGENPEAMKHFENCKQLRRQILRYIQFVESEQWLGGLIHANEELVDALTLFEALDKPIEEDSDSDLEDATSRMGKMRVGGESSKSPPPERRRAPPPPTGAARKRMEVPRTLRDTTSEDELEDVSDDEPEDPDNPFGDSHALKTPAAEKEAPHGPWGSGNYGSYGPPGAGYGGIGYNPYRPTGGYSGSGPMHPNSLGHSTHQVSDTYGAATGHGGFSDPGRYSFAGGYGVNNGGWGSHAPPTGRYW